MAKKRLLTRLFEAADNDDELWDADAEQRLAESTERINQQYLEKYGTTNPTTADITGVPSQSEETSNESTFAKFAEALDKANQAKNNPFTNFGLIGESIAKGISLLDPNGDKALLTTEQKVNYANNNIANLSDENKNKLNEYNDILDNLDASRMALTDSFNPEENERFAANSQRLKDLKASLQQDLNIDDETFNKYVSSSKFLKNLEDRQRQQEEYANASAGEKVLANIGDALLAPVRPYTTLKGYLDEKGNPYYDENLGVDHNATGFDLANINRDVTTQATKDIEELTGANEEDANLGNKAANEVLKTLYTGVKSGADSMARLATGEVSTLLGAGLEAADQQYVDAGERGLTKAQAIGTAISSGAAEAVFEKIPVDNMLKLWKNGAEGVAKGGVKSAVKEILQQAGLEGMEEVETDIANKFSDAIINKDKSEFNTQVEEYKAQGMDEAEAFGRTLLDNVADTVESFAGGAIGGLVGGGGAIAGSVATTKEAKKLDGNYREVAQAIPDNVEAYNSEEDYNKAMEVKARAEELDTQDKVSSADRSGLLQDIYAVNETMPNTDLIESINESVNSPFADVGGFQVAKNDITSQQVAQSMSQASQDNNINDFVEAYRDSQASNNAEARQTGQQYFNTLSPKFYTYDEGSRLLDDAMSENTADELYTMALNGEDVAPELLNTQKKADYYNQGVERRNNLIELQNQVREQRKAQELKEKEAIGQTTIQKVETPKGKADIADISINNDGSFVWKKGEEEVVIPKKDISDKAMQQYMEYATSQPTLRAKQLYADNYVGSVPINSYNMAFNAAVNAGRTNYGFKSWLKSKPYFEAVGVEALQKFYDYGAEEAKGYNKTVKARKAVKSENKFGGVKTSDKGKLYIDGEASEQIKDTGIYEIAKQFQKAHKTSVGVDYGTLMEKTKVAKVDDNGNIVRDSNGNVEMEEKELLFNGEFRADLNQILLGVNGKEYQTLSHEGIGEKMLAYTAQEASELYDAMAIYLQDTMGADAFNDAIQGYIDRYNKAGKKADFSYALNEYINDSLVGIFSTEKGQRDFVENLTKNEDKSLIDKFKELFNRLLNKVHQLVEDMKKNNQYTEGALKLMEAGEEQLQEWRDEVFRLLDLADERAEGTSNEETMAASLDNTQFSLDVDSIETNSNNIFQFDNENLNKEEQTGVFKKIESSRGLPYIWIIAPKYVSNDTWKALAEIEGTDWKNLKDRAVRSNIYYINNSHTQDFLEYLTGEEVEDNTKLAEEKAEEAEETFGTTSSWEDTGYLTTNGSQIDLSVMDSGVSYREDHNSISEIMDSNGVDAVYDFLKLGNIRIIPEVSGIELIEEPNSEQYDKLYDYFVYNNGEASVDLSNDKGGGEGTILYREGTSPQRILSDIENYFETGEVPEGTDDGNVYYSLDTEDNELTEGQQDFFKDSKIRDEQGRLLVVYHGTPNGEFNTFNNRLNFYTANKEYADRYATGDNARQYKGYLNITKPFDITDKETRRIFFDEYVKGGWSYSIDPGISRAELEKRIANGIDWTEADNLKDFIEENELDYDGLILNEGGDPTEDGVRYRGNSYVTFNSNQFKNVDNENPTESEDIRYCLDVPTTYALDEDLSDEELKELFPGADDDMIEYKDSKELFVNTVMDAASKVLDFNISDSQVNQIAKWLIDTYNSEETEDYISRNLRNIFSGLKTNNYEDMVNALQNLTEEVAEKAKEVDPDDQARYDSFIKSIPSFRFSEYQVQEMNNRDIYKNVFGKIGFKTNANSPTLDGNLYWEICDAAQAHGYTMKREVSDLDQIDEISKAIDYFKPQSKPMFEGADITDGALESAREIMRRYFKYAQLANQTDDSLKEVQKELKRQTDEYKKKVGKIYQEQVKKLQEELSQLKDEKKLANMQGQQLYERLAKAENKASDTKPSKEEVKQNFKDFSSAMPKFRLTDEQRKQAIEDMGAWNSVWSRLKNYMNKDAQDLDDAMYKQIVELAKQHGFDGMAENTDHKAKEIIRAIAMIKNPSYQGDNETIKKLSYENWELNTDLQQAQRMALRDKKSLSRKIERMERNKHLKSIRNQAIRLIKMIDTPTRTKFVPEILQKPTIEMLRSLDIVTYRVRKNGELVPWGEEKGGEPTKTTLLWHQKLKELQGVLKELEHITDDKTDLSKYGANASYLYNLGAQLGDVTEGLLDKFLQDNPRVNIKISMLDSEKLGELDDFMKSYLASINNAQETMIDGNNVQLAKIGQQVASEIGELNSLNAVEGTIKKKILDFLNLDMAEPITVFSELGGTMEKLYWHLEKGKDVRDGHIFATEDAFNKAKEELNIDKNEPSKWETGLMSFKDGQLQLTPAQVMSLYAAYGRSQARHHIIFGGVKASDKGLRGKDKKLKKVQTKPVHLTPKDVEEIVSTLTPKQKALADFMVEYMSNEVSDWGNRVSQKRWGIKLFTESHYFPIKTYDATRRTIKVEGGGSNTLYSLQNQGFTKPLVKDANNALVLEDIFSVFADHVAKMAAYDGYVIPINDFMRVFNYAESEETFAVKQGEEGMHRDDMSVKEQIERVFGEKGTQYFTKFIKNVNEDFGEGGSINLIDKLFSNNKAQAVLANGRVVIQQPTAYPRAMEVIDGKYLVKALSTSPVGLKKKIQRSKSHNTLAKFKSKGYYETSIGQSMQQMITGTATPKDKVNEVAGALAGLADDITWSIIYQAAEYKVQAEQKKLKVDSKEYFDAVNKIANEAYIKTQVVDSVFTKSQMMRSRDTGDKMLTAFMAEPTKYYNMLHRGVFNMVQHGNKKAFAKAVYLFVVGQVLNSVAQSAYDAWRDDDDEKDAMEKFLNALLGISDIQEADGVWATMQAILKANLVENLLPINLLPVVKEVNSALAGWDSKNMSTQAIYDIVGDAKKIVEWTEGKGTLTTYGVLNTVAHSLSLATGMPVSSALREVKDLYNHVNNLWDGTNLVKNEQKESAKSKIASSDNIQETVKTLYQEKVQENLEKGKTQQEAEKAAKSSVGSAITGAYKEQLVELRKTNMSEATSMKAEAIKGFTALGISQADANKRVEKWFK